MGATRVGHFGGALFSAAKHFRPTILCNITIRLVAAVITTLERIGRTRQGMGSGQATTGLVRSTGLVRPNAP